MRFLVTGATGLIGSELSSYLINNGHTVINLTRKMLSENDLIWNPSENILPTDEQLENFDCWINLAGESIIAPHWSRKKKILIRESRVNSTTLLVEALKRLKRPPKLFLSASATGFYGSRGSEPLLESAPPGNGFLADVCSDWESSAWQANKIGIRVAILRIGMVLTNKGGALATMLPFFKKGLGSVLGKGNQWISWITLHDLIRMIYFIALHPHLSGVFNATSPNPVTNKMLTELLAKKVNKRTFIPVPEWILQFFMKDFANEVLLASTYVIPNRAYKANFSFDSPYIQQALID